jgi:hypothetical protein
MVRQVIQWSHLNGQDRVTQQSDGMLGLNIGKEMKSLETEVEESMEEKPTRCMMSS